MTNPIPDTTNNLNFIAALLLLQKRRDDAIGLRWVTKEQKGLIWFYNTKKRELFTQAARAAFAQSALQQIDSRMAEIVTEAENAPPERQRELLLESLALGKQAEGIRENV